MGGNSLFLKPVGIFTFEKYCISFHENSQVIEIQRERKSTGSKWILFLQVGYLGIYQPSVKHYCSLYNMVVQIKTVPAGEQHSNMAGLWGG